MVLHKVKVDQLDRFAKKRVLSNADLSGVSDGTSGSNPFEKHNLDLKQMLGRLAEIRTVRTNSFWGNF